MPSYETIWIFKDLPLGVGTLRVGPVEVKPMVYWDIDHDTKELMREKYGRELEELWFEQGFVGALVETEADNPREAIQQLFPLMNSVAEVLALRLKDLEVDISLAAETAPRVLSTVAVREVGNGDTLFYRYHQELLMTLNVDKRAQKRIAHFNRRIFAHLLNRIPPEILSGSPAEGQAEAATRIRRSVHWWSESKAARPLASKFMLAWTALESVLSCSQDGHSRIGDRIKLRLSTLVGKHTGAAVSSGDFDTLWKLRCEVIHEAATGFFDPAANHARDIVAHLDRLNYLVMVAILHVLDTWRSFPSLRDMWDNVADYSPSMHIKPVDLPGRYLAFDYLAGPGVGDNSI